MREGVEVFAADGQSAGTVTSGGFSPTLERPIAMGYLSSAIEAGGRVAARVRGREAAVGIVTLPFVPASLFQENIMTAETA